MRLFLLLIMLALTNVVMAETTTFPVGTKGTFYCQVNDLGYAQLFRNNPTTELSLNNRIRAWRRKKTAILSRTRHELPNTRYNLRGLAEINRLIRDGKDCRSRNIPANACPLYIETSPAEVRLNRIISGASCSGASSPVVYLDLFNASNSRLGACTGTVVHPRIIISAAHCLADDGSGEADNVDIFDLNNTFLATATDLRYNASYNDFPSQSDYDIAVIRTATDLVTDIMAIHTANDIQAEEIAIIAGYGLDNNQNSGSLKAGFVSIYGIPDNSIEARYLPGSGSNTCYGDSGGPIAVLRGDTWKLIGATSNGVNESCGLNGRSDLSRWVNITSSNSLTFLQANAPELFE